MTYQPLPTQESGGQKRVWTVDDETRELLHSVLGEMRKLNIQLAEITNQEVGAGDVKE